MSRVERMRAFLIRVAYILVLAALIFGVLKYALPFFAPFVMAFIIAFALKPLINLIDKKTKLSRRLVAILTLTLLYAVLVFLVSLLGAKLIVYLGSWFSSLPAYYRSTVEPVLYSWGDTIDLYIRQLDPSLIQFFNTASDSLTSSLSRIVTSISSGAINIVSNIATKVPLFIVGLFLTIITSYFFVVDYYKITHFIAIQLSNKHRRLLFVVKDFVVNTLFRFARAYFMIICITFTEVFIGLLILRVEHAFSIALLIAVVDIVPILGTGTIVIPWALYSLFNSNFFLGIGLLVIYAVVAVVRQVIEPKIVGKQIGLYPLLTLVSMFIGARLFGFWGLFALPISLTVLIHLNKAGEIKIFKEELEVDKQEELPSSS